MHALIYETLTHSNTGSTCKNCNTAVSVKTVKIVLHDAYAMMGRTNNDKSMQTPTKSFQVHTMSRKKVMDILSDLGMKMLRNSIEIF